MKVIEVMIDAASEECVLGYHRAMMILYISLAHILHVVAEVARHIRRRAVIMAARHSSEYWRLA